MVCARGCGNRGGHRRQALLLYQIEAVEVDDDIAQPVSGDGSDCLQGDTDRLG